MHLLMIAALASSPALAAPTAYTLTELFHATVGTSDTYLEKTEENVQASENKSKARSGFLPTITGYGTYMRADNPAGNPSGTTYSSEQKNAKLTGKQYIFQGGSEYAYYAKANRLLEASESDLEQSRRQYYIDLASAYYDLLLKQALFTHSKTELDLYDDQIKELVSRVKIGRSRSADLLNIRAARASSEARYQAAKSDLRTSRLALNNLTKTSDVDVREENPVDRPLDSVDAYLKSSEQRPDLVAARKRRDAAEEDIAYYRGFHFPDLDVGANYYLHREGANPDSKWDATLTLTLPIFSGGLTQANVRNASSVLRETEVATGLLERTAQTEIRQLHQVLANSEKEMKALTEAVDLAEKAYEQTKKDYRYGLTTNLDLLETLRFLTEAKKSYDQAKYQHLVERIRLEIGAGRIVTTS